MTIVKQFENVAINHNYIYSLLYLAINHLIVIIAVRRRKSMFNLKIKPRSANSQQIMFKQIKFIIYITTSHLGHKNAPLKLKIGVDIA